MRTLPNEPAAPRPLQHEMSDFSDISSKLGAPAKKSIFERQKAEAEAKKAREQAETAAVLKEFERSFEDDGGRTVPAPSRGSGLPSGPGKRHFTSSGMKSGPGSLGHASIPKTGPGSLGPSFGRKRQYDDYNDKRDRGDRGGVFSYNDDRKQSFDRDRDDDEKAAAKPTLHLSSLPPGTSPAVIKGLLAQSPLTVESVRILPPAAPSGPSIERKSTSAIVVLAADTPGNEIDTVVSHLANKYLGLGYNLSISRHLSSAVSNVNIASGGTNNLPFGARPVQQHGSLSRAPPPSQRFAPPSSYTSSVPYTKSSTQVSVQAPSDLKQLKLIHKMLEALLTYGPEFEALLMSRLEIQMDEKWSWLFNPRSAGGVYYRWRLWEVLTDAKSRRRHGRFNTEPLFDGQSVWVPPDDALRFEYTTQIDEFVSDDDYNSSDEEEHDNGGLADRYTDHNASNAAAEDALNGAGYLNPLAKSKLVHLLSRLPDSSSKLRKGDVARITAFAIEHAGAGAEEVAMTITRNVVKQFHDNDEDDQTPGSLVGLYVISDILSSSASAGVRHAWRYRNLFEGAFRKQRVFEKLGRAEKDLSWGKLKAEKWRRSIQALFALWEGWSVFPQASHERFVHNFMNPPLTEKEKAVAEAEEKRRADEEARNKKVVSRWRTVDDEQTGNGDVSMTDMDGVAMRDDSDMEDVVDENIDGVPMEDSSDEEHPAKRTSAEPSTSITPVKRQASSIAQTPPVSMTGGKRQRPRAADMFADDSE